MWLNGINIETPAVFKRRHAGGLAASEDPATDTDVDEPLEIDRIPPHRSWRNWFRRL